MNIRFVIRMLGLVLLGFAGSMLLPLGIAVVEQDHTSLRAFAISISSALIAGLLCFGAKSSSSQINLKSGLVFVVLAWLLCTAFGALPYYLGLPLHYTDAFFESISGLTTTGASIFQNPQDLPRSLLFWRSLTQLLGGLAVLAFGGALVSFHGSESDPLYRSENTGTEAEKFFARLKASVHVLWGVYFSFALILVCLLRILGMSWFEALCHTFSTISTGGFSTQANNIGAFDSPSIQWTLIFFMWLMGMNFSWHYHYLFPGKLKIIFKNREFRLYSLLILAVSIGLVLLNFSGTFREETLRASLFQAVSFISTTGFYSENYNLWPLFSQYLLFILLLVGACAGSTGGGIKVARVYILFKLTFNHLVQILHPQAVVNLKIGKQNLEEYQGVRIMGFLFLYFIIGIVSAVILCMVGEKMSISFMATLSCLGNVGVGLAGLGVTESYFGLHVLSKWTLCFCMLVGRLELFALLIFMLPSFWRKGA